MEVLKGRVLTGSEMPSAMAASVRSQGLGVEQAGWRVHRNSLGEHHKCKLYSGSICCALLTGVAVDLRGPVGPLHS